MEDVFGGPLNPGPQVAYVSDDDDADVGADGLPGDASDDDDAVVNWTMYFVKMRKAAAVGAMTVLGFLAPFLAGFPLPFCAVCALALRIRARTRDMDFLRGRKDGPAWGFDHYFSEDYPDMRFQEDFKVAKSTAAALRDTLLFVDGCFRVIFKPSRMEGEFWNPHESYKWSARARRTAHGAHTQPCCRVVCKSFAAVAP